MYISRGTSREDREGRVRGQRGGQHSFGLHLGCINGGWAASDHGHVGEDSDGVVGERRGEGVDRRAAHQEPLAGERLAREVTERRVERRVELPPPPVEAAVETVSAAEVLAGVAEHGPNYSLPQPAESKTARRKRLRLDAAARIAGHAVVEAGTHVEILGEHRWWPGTITGREEGSDGRLVHAVEYDGYPDQDFRLNLEEVSWRRVTLGAGGAAPTSGEDSDGEGSDEAADALPASATDSGSAVATSDKGSDVEGDGDEAGDALLTCEPAPTQPRERRSTRAGDESPAAAGMASGDAGATYAALGGYVGREEAVGKASSAPAALSTVIYKDTKLDGTCGHAHVHVHAGRRAQAGGAPRAGGQAPQRRAGAAADLWMGHGMWHARAWHGRGMEIVTAHTPGSVCMEREVRKVALELLAVALARRAVRAVRAEPGLGPL